MRQFVQISLAALVVAFMLSFAPTPVSAGQRYTQGGVIPCSADDYSFVRGRWVSNCRGHVGRRGGRHIVVQPYIYLQSRTCVDWVIRGGVKIILGTRAC